MSRRKQGNKECRGWRVALFRKVFRIVLMRKMNTEQRFQKGERVSHGDSIKENISGKGEASGKAQGWRIAEMLKKM